MPLNPPIRSDCIALDGVNPSFARADEAEEDPPRPDPIPKPPPDMPRDPSMPFASLIKPAREDVIPDAPHAGADDVALTPRNVELVLVLPIPPPTGIAVGEAIGMFVAMLLRPGVLTVVLIAVRGTSKEVGFISSPIMVEVARALSPPAADPTVILSDANSAVVDEISPARVRCSRPAAAVVARCTALFRGTTTRALRLPPPPIEVGIFGTAKFGLTLATPGTFAGTLRLTEFAAACARQAALPSTVPRIAIPVQIQCFLIPSPVAKHCYIDLAIRQNIRCRNRSSARHAWQSR